MRRLIDLSCNIRESHHYVRVTLPGKSDLAWWSVCLSLFNGTCGFTCDVPLPSYCFASDACDTAGGAFCGQDWFYANWESDFPWVKSRHINEQELFTVFLGLLRWGPLMRGCHIRIRSDNMATIAAIKNSTSRSADLMPYIREIFWLVVRFDLTISAVHIKGDLNILTDRISRLDSCRMAMDARLLLANFSNSVIFVRGHISPVTFDWLQESWTRTSRN